MVLGIFANPPRRVVDTDSVSTRPLGDGLIPFGAVSPSMRYKLAINAKLAYSRFAAQKSRLVVRLVLE